MARMKRLGIYIPADILDRVRAEAKTNGVSMSTIIWQRVRHSFMNDMAYINYINAELELARQKDSENESN